MGKKKKKTSVCEKRSAVMLSSSDMYEMICTSGYTSLANNPEVLTACRKIADQISSMTIYLMNNGKKGDERIKNELSRALDICPNPYMTRKTFIDGIVMNLLLYGKGNAVVLPHTKNGYLDYLEPIAASRVQFEGDYDRYKVLIDGKPYESSEVLHFVLNPDKEYLWMGRGITAALKDVAMNLKQAGETTKAFMESKWKPSVIVKVDALVDEFSSPAGRSKLLNEYISTAKAGEPWLIPAEQFAVEQIRPLSLADLAIADTVKLDKQTVASIVGVPAFVLGIGEFKQDAWNACVDSVMRTIAIGIEQEFTKKLLLNPNWYWKFNVSSLYSYNIETICNTYGGLYDRGIVTGNEVRDKISMTPLDGLDKPLVLENYIPVDSSGSQKKLKQEEKANG